MKHRLAVSASTSASSASSAASAASALPARRLFQSLHPSSRAAPAVVATVSAVGSELAAPPPVSGRRGRTLPQVWFSPSFPANLGGQPENGKPPDERTLKLGKTLRILQERMPTLLQSPLPSEILAPTISLHLFPSTHPHLPVVSGRVAYIAALWTSPLAWNRVPLVGNVQLEILSERMTGMMASRTPPSSVPTSMPGYQPRAGAGDEQLVVRWRTVGGGAITTFFKQQQRPPQAQAQAQAQSQSQSQSQSPDTSLQSLRSSSSRHVVGTGQAVDDPNEFTGLFIFEFDSEGRVLSHTIEHVAEGSEWERSVGARFVGLTDWLLGGIKGSGGGETPMPAFEKLRGGKMQ